MILSLLFPAESQQSGQTVQERSSDTTLATNITVWPFKPSAFASIKYHIHLLGVRNDTSEIQSLHYALILVLCLLWMKFQWGLSEIQGANAILHFISTVLTPHLSHHSSEGSEVSSPVCST